jgi:WD40 repeat protein
LVLRGHEGTVHGVAFSPDGKRIATVGDDGAARVWDA